MIDPILNKAHDQMLKAVDITKNDLMSIHSGRATPALVENIFVSVYGGTAKMRIMELATITTSDAKTIVIAPFDSTVTEEIVKGIQEANLGMTPVSEGDVIRISIPPLSEERRREYIKLAKVKIEGGRIMIRQIRQEAMKDLKKLETENQITEDQVTHGEKKIQELTDEMIAEMDGLGDRKEQELLQI